MFASEAELTDRINQTLAESVFAASRREEVALAVSGLYREIGREIDIRRPRCEMSGRCCRFEEFGHRLYVTTLELAAFVRKLPGVVHERNDRDPTGCPFQSGRVCTVHAIRPFGCRIFFCDATSTQWQQALYETFHARLKQLHEQLDVPYAYLEWRQALKMLGGDLPVAGC